MSSATSTSIAWLSANPTPMDLRSVLAALPAPGEAWAAAGLRALSEEERRRLTAQGNAAEDWDLLRVGPGFAADRIHGTMFRGRCVLHACELVQSLLEDVVCGAAVRANVAAVRVEQSTVRNVYLGAGAHVLRSLIGDAAGGGRFGIGMEIEPGIETGGRSVRLHPDWTFPAAAERVDAPPAPGDASGPPPGPLQDARVDAPAAGAKNGAAGVDKTAAGAKSGAAGTEKTAAGAKSGAAGTDNTAAWLEELLRVLPSYNTVVLDGARITAASQVRDSIIGLYGVVDGAVALEDVTLLSTVDQPSRCGTGAVVRGAILQEGVTVETGALVERSMLFETVHVERHGKVTESLIGPNTEIGEGEVTASVVGPFVGMHHQSLLIAALWPEGRGNIGYGANVGSNHTSRTADQEIHPGAGTFFGLGTSVKFPANFRDAPYSVIATGSTTLPQRVGFPFSLITTPMIVPADGDAADGGGGQAGGMQSGEAGGMQSGEAGGMQSGEAGGMKGREVGYPPGINQILPGWGLYANAYALFRNERKFRTRNRARRHAAPESIISPALIAAMERARDLLRSATAREAEDLQPIDWRSIPELGKNFATLADCRRGAEAYERFIHFFSLYLRLTAEDASQELSDDELVSFDGAFAEIYRIAERSRRKDVERGSRIIDDYEAVHPAVEEDAVLAWMQREIGGLSQRLREARG